MAKARNQLDAVLQCLLEKSHMDRLGSGPAWGTCVGGIWVGASRLTMGRLLNTITLWAHATLSQ